jgi:hypothetical protein
VGGAIAQESLPALNTIKDTHLTRFETRKIIFSSDVLENPSNAEAGLKNAVMFELLWLQNKRNYYSAIEQEDSKRIEMLERRLNTLLGKDDIFLKQANA